MKRPHAFILAIASLALCSPTFASDGTSGDTTYFLEGASAGYSGWIELNSDQGTYPVFPALGSPSFIFFGVDPIVAYDIVTPENTFSSSDPNVSVVGLPYLTWNPTEITYLNLVLNDSDPWGADIDFNLNGGLDINVLDANGAIVGTDTNGVFATPDNGATGMLLAGVGAGLLFWQRRMAKVA